MRCLTRAAWFLTCLSVVPAVSTRGQSIGYGASPGRAAYRPAWQWNNGPYYTTRHIDPYAPHRAAPTNLYESEPLVAPWTTGPHGLYPTFFPGNGVLYPYADGFSPYSGFAPWFARTYDVVPTRQVIQGAREQFFRSAPLPPPGFLPPLPPAGPVPVAIPAAARRAEPTSIKVFAPQEGPTPLPRVPVRVYRSSVAGG